MQDIKSQLVLDKWQRKAWMKSIKAAGGIKADYRNANSG